MNVGVERDGLVFAEQIKQPRARRFLSRFGVEAPVRPRAIRRDRRVREEEDVSRSPLAQRRLQPVERARMIVRVKKDHKRISLLKCVKASLETPRKFFRLPQFLAHERENDLVVSLARPRPSYVVVAFCDQEGRAEFGLTDKG